MGGNPSQNLIFLALAQFQRIWGQAPAPGLFDFWGRRLRTLSQQAAVAGRLCVAGDSSGCRFLTTGQLPHYVVIELETLQHHVLSMNLLLGALRLACLWARCSRHAGV